MASSADEITVIVTGSTTAIPSSSSKGTPQGGILDGLDPTDYDPKHP